MQQIVKAVTAQTLQLLLKKLPQYEGFIAHELQEVGALSKLNGEKDATDENGIDRKALNSNDSSTLLRLHSKRQ